MSERLTAEYGKGFRRSNVFHMIRFAEVFDDPKIVQTLSGLLSWSHFVEIIYLKDALQRQFYVEMARVERWSVRTLRQKMQGMLYERTAISRKPEELARQELEALQEKDRMTPDPCTRGSPGGAEAEALTLQAQREDLTVWEMEIRSKRAGKAPRHLRDGLLARGRQDAHLE